MTAMLKRIGTDQLRLGMYVQEILGPWMNHPFWRGSFKLDQQDDLKTLRNSKIDQVLIDTAKGYDILIDPPAPPAPAATQHAPSADKVKPPVPSKIAIHVSTEQEREVAAQVLTSSRQAILTLFNQTRMGKALDVRQALPVVQEITASVSRNSGALLSLARLKSTDDYTYMHSVAVCALMISLGHQLGLSAEETRQTEQRPGIARHRCRDFLHYR